MTDRPLAPASIAAQAGGLIDEATRAVVPPVHVAATFLRDPDNQYRSGRGYMRAFAGTERAIAAMPTAVLPAPQGSTPTPEPAAKKPSLFTERRRPAASSVMLPASM